MPAYPIVAAITNARAREVDCSSWREQVQCDAILNVVIPASVVLDCCLDGGDEAEGRNLPAEIDGKIVKSTPSRELCQ